MSDKDGHQTPAGDKNTNNDGKAPGDNGSTVDTPKAGEGQGDGTEPKPDSGSKPEGDKIADGKGDLSGKPEAKQSGTTSNVESTKGNKEPDGSKPERRGTNEAGRNGSPTGSPPSGTTVKPTTGAAPSSTTPPVQSRRGPRFKRHSWRRTTESAGEEAKN